MKKLIISCLIWICILGVFSCAKLEGKTVTLPDDITKITIAWDGGPLTTFSYTDRSKIEKIREYLTSLVLVPTKKDAELHMGGAWVITVESSLETLEMLHYGNMFFKTANGEWWEISYEQATEFGNILKANVPDELPQNIVFDEWID